MITSLSKLAELIEQGTVPPWLKSEVIAHKEEIQKALRENRAFVIQGPNGETVSIAPKEAVAA